MCWLGSSSQLAMSENVRSMILGPSVLWVVAGVALGLTIFRRPMRFSTEAFESVTRLYLIGIAFQCLHFTEEFVTGFYIKVPPFLGFVSWSPEFFVIFNLIWVALWVSAAVGIRSNLRVAFFPVWFFSIAMVGNAIWHPLLSLATGGYFPGLYTSPFGGVIGLLLLPRLWKLTSAHSSESR